MLKTLLICMVLLGVQPTTDDQSAPPQPQRLTEIRNAVAAADETIQQQAASSIEAATKFMERAATAEKSTAQSDAEIQNAPTRLETIRQELTARLPDPEPIPDTEKPAHWELVRLAIPRRVYTQSHMDYVIEAVTAVKARAAEIRGLKMVRAPRFLRYFTAEFARL